MLGCGLPRFSGAGHQAGSAAGSHQPEADGLRGGVASGSRAELAEDGRYVVVDGLDGDEQPSRDLLVRRSGADQVEDLLLACGETGRMLPCRGAGPAGTDGAPSARNCRRSTAAAGRAPSCSNRSSAARSDASVPSSRSASAASYLQPTASHASAAPRWSASTWRRSGSGSPSASG